MVYETGNAGNGNTDTAHAAVPVPIGYAPVRTSAGTVRIQIVPGTVPSLAKTFDPRATRAQSPRMKPLAVVDFCRAAVAQVLMKH